MENIKEKKHILIIVIWILVLYVKTIFFSFVTDDWINIFENIKIYSLTDIKSIFLKPQVNFGGDTYYRPLDTIYFLFCYKSFGDNPVYYHFLNIFFFLLYSVLFYKFLSKYIVEKVLALLLTILLISHPLMVEPVAWISARNQILLGIFCYSILISFHKFIEEKNYIFLFISIISYVFSFLFHEIGVTFIFLLFFFTYFIYKKSKFDKKYFYYLVPFLIFFISYLLFRFNLFPLREEKSVYVRLLTSFVIFKKVILNIIFPFNLKVFYDELKVSYNFDSDLTLSLLVFIIFWLFCTVNSFKNRKFLLGFIIFLITYLPVSGIFKLIYKSLTADRYLFLPISGFLIMFAVFIDRHFQNWKKGITFLILAVSIIFSIKTFYTTEIWKDDLSNAIAVVEQNPNNIHYLNNLAVEYLKAGQVDLAEKIINSSINISSNPYDFIYATLAIIEKFKGNIEKAEKIYLEYLKYDKNNYRINYNLGTLYLERGEIDKAKIFLTVAYKNVNYGDLNRADIINNLGIISLIEGDKEIARKYFLEALSIKPYDKKFLNNLELTNNTR